MKNPIDQSDSIQYQLAGFDADKYLELQKAKILERIARFENGRLYLEIGGKFLFDPHAARALPGFDPVAKKQIFASLSEDADIWFCVDYGDIVENRQLSNEEQDYGQASLQMATSIEKEIGLKPKIIINKCKQERMPIADFEKMAKEQGFEVYFRYFIEGYPHETEKVLSAEGFGKDDDIPNGKPLVLVTGAASNSGKMSTCIGQIYLDHQNGIDSGYAKYETFPIWNLPIDHPINLAYEAATADIGDYNTFDTYHEEAYNEKSVNYNRDVDAFELLMKLGKEIVSENNYVRQYKSPTDMGISNAGFCIKNDEIVSVASLQEIGRRKEWYQEIINRGEGQVEWVQKCESLELKAISYLEGKNYDSNLAI